MAVAILRKPDPGGVRIDVQFKDRDDASAVWLNRDRGGLAWEVDIKSDRRAKLSEDAEMFLMEAAVLAATEYLKLDPLDEPPRTI